MVAWETMHTLANQPSVVQDFAKLWQAADKIVYSRTPEMASSARTRIERALDQEAVRQMKAPAGRDISVGGPDLAAQAIKAGLVDECHLFITPILVGGGNPSLPSNCPCEARTAGRTPFQQRRRVPPLSHQDVKRRRRVPRNGGKPPYSGFACKKASTVCAMAFPASAGGTVLFQILLSSGLIRPLILS